MARGQASTLHMPEGWDPGNPIVGIDPGVRGALALINPLDWTMAVIDTPNRPVVVNKKERTEVDVQRFGQLLRILAPRLIVSEKLHSRPGHGGQGDFSLGRSFGHIEMGATMISAPHYTPTPQEWKRRMQVSADKDFSRQRGIQLFPDAAAHFQQKQDHDRAEAALLALFGCFYLGLTPGRIVVVKTKGEI